MSHAVSHGARIAPVPSTSSRPGLHRACHQTRRSLHRQQYQWWQETPTPKANDILERLTEGSSLTRALTATLEFSVECTIQAYKDAGRTDPLERCLTYELGENLLRSCERHEIDGFGPRAMLDKVLRGSDLDPDAAAETLAAELKRRFASRRSRLRDACVCITWRGTHTNLSTLNRRAVLDVSTALSLGEDDFEATLATVTSVAQA